MYCLLFCNSIFLLRSFLFNIYIICLLTPTVISGNPCALLKFDSPLNRDGVVFFERGTADLQFHLENISCSNQSDYDIEISHLNKDGVFSPQCFIIQKQNDCHSKSYHKFLECSCLSNVGPYRFITTNITSDNTTWRWGVENNIADTVTITLKRKVVVQYRLTNFTIDGKAGRHIASRNQTVSVVCSWEGSLHSNTVHLSYTNGSKIRSNDITSNNIKHTFSNIQCQDAGEIRCEANDERNNQDGNLTATLLVECPPELINTSFLYNTNSGEMTAFLITFRAHTALITRCELKHHQETFSTEKITDETMKEYSSHRNVSTELRCKTGQIAPTVQMQQGESCLCSTSGTPPDLLLTIRLFSFKKLGGRLRVSVSNDVGSGHRDIFIDNNDGSSKADDTPTTSYFIHGIATTAAVILAFTISILIIKQKLLIHCRQLRRQGSGHIERESIINSADLNHTTIGSRLPIRRDVENKPITSQIFHPSASSEAAEDDPGLKFMWCKGADITQVVFYIKGQPINPEMIETSTLQRDNANSLTTTPSLEYSTLEADQQTANSHDRHYSTVKNVQRDDYITPCFANSYTTLSSGDDCAENDIPTTIYSSECGEKYGEASYASISQSNNENNDTKLYNTL